MLSRCVLVDVHEVVVNAVVVDIVNVAGDNAFGFGVFSWFCFFFVHPPGHCSLHRRRLRRAGTPGASEEATGRGARLRTGPARHGTCGSSVA